MIEQRLDELIASPESITPDEVLELLKVYSFFHFEIIGDYVKKKFELLETLTTEMENLRASKKSIIEGDDKVFERLGFLFTKPELINSLKGELLTLEGKEVNKKKKGKESQQVAVTL